MAYSWAVAVTTTPARRDDLLPRTLASLDAGGFPKPRLFVDACPHAEAAGYAQRFGLDVTTHWPTLRAFGTWCLALAESYIRSPYSDFYLVAQDDLLCLRNLRQYLEACPMQPRTYWNCLTFPTWRRRQGNQERFPRVGQTARFYEGWYPSNQKGWGAVALVFSNEAARALLAHTHMIDRPRDARRGHRLIDGGVVSAMGKAGYRELCHNPSLVLHTGKASVLRAGGYMPFPDAPSWRGENFDALELLKYPDRLGTV